MALNRGIRHALDDGRCAYHARAVSGALSSLLYRFKRHYHRHAILTVSRLLDSQSIDLHTSRWTWKAPYAETQLLCWSFQNGYDRCKRTLSSQVVCIITIVRH